MPDERENSPDEKKLREKYGLDPPAGANLQTVSTAGLELGLVVLVSVFGGWALDRWLDTSPWFTLIGVAVGIGGGMIRFVLRFMKVS